jgi:hypothetical protein
MKTISAFALAMVLASGAALAQGTTGGAGGAGGTTTGPSGTSTGKDASAMPTAQECSQGWKSGMRWSQSEFEAACKAK